jgi:3-dehydroquinate synthase
MSKADVTFQIIASGEANKTFSTVLSVCSAASEAGLGRKDLLVALGGGVCCDIVTVASSLVRRGLPYVCLPTTVIAQVDAAIGLKGAVNYDGKKNYLGCYNPPERVLVDPQLLATLPPAHVRNGIAEIAKMALIRDPLLWDAIASSGRELIRTGFSRPFHAGRNLLRRSIHLMLEELAPNCFEDKSLERLVDFGHTFSPQIEAESAYSIGHGYAVAMDMAITCALGVQLSLLDPATCHEILGVFDLLGLPTSPQQVSVGTLLEGMEAACAHRAGDLNLVVPVAIGSATFVRDRSALSPEILNAALEFLAARHLVEAV